jgi:perosamine synthetase
MTHAWWMFTMLLDRPEHRETVTKALAADGIETRPVFYPVHEMPPYRDAVSDGGCPVTTSVSYRGISLPSSSYLTDADVDHIADRVRAAVAGVRTLRKAA